MEQDSFLFSTKIDKMIVLVRILREYQVTPPELNEGLIGKLLRHNIETTLVALSESRPQEETIQDFMRRVNAINREKLSREEKREIIQEDLAEFGKIKKRYLRGYPEKS